MIERFLLGVMDGVAWAMGQWLWARYGFEDDEQRETDDGDKTSDKTAPSG